MPLFETAPAKLNLFLNVTGRRDDGYHELHSLFAFVGCVDRLSFEPSSSLSLSLDGPFAAGLGASDNLVLKAARRLASAGGREPTGRLHLEKNVPVAAGLGGGSSDAAAALRLLNRAWGLGWPFDRLLSLAAEIGADVPACLLAEPVVARGIGEILSPAAAMPPCGLLLVNPRLPTPTPAVFKAFRALNPAIAPRALPPLPEAFAGLDALVAAIAPRGNDLLPAALAVTPAIGDVLDALGVLPGVAHAGLSGSGATCFALFDRMEEAGEAAATLARTRGWWTWAGGWART